MIRRLLIVLSALTVYLLFLVITFPALHAWGFLKQQLPPIKANYIEGTVWNARVSRLQIGGMEFNKVQAGLKLLPLMAGKVSIAARLSNPGITTSASISPGPKEIVVSDLEATLHASQLKRFAYPGVALFGKMTLELNRLKFARGQLQFAEGKGLWDGAQIHGPLKLSLGKIHLTVKTRNKKVRATFRNKGTADKVRGSIEIGQNGQYSLRIYFTPARLSAEQRSWLLTISKPGPNGSYQFYNKGYLFSQSAVNAIRRRP